MAVGRETSGTNWSRWAETFTRREPLFLQDAGADTVGRMVAGKAYSRKAGSAQSMMPEDGPHCCE